MSTAEERLAKLLDKCRSPDTDAKVDAISKLQLEFEAGIELPDLEPVLTALKTCLRTPNQILTTATLSALPAFFTLLVNPSRLDTPTSTSSSSTTTSETVALRQAIIAFLPAGGIIDRLGDARAISRDKAREALISLGNIVFKHGGSGATGSAFRGKESGKGPEPPSAMFERHIRELAFPSKVWRVREQTILTLLAIRRTHPQFPIRPYLPQLVDTLEDGDGTVRECARQSVIELFTGAAVTDAARADLKKEMTKKNVRKTTVDTILGKLLGTADRGESPHPTPPPSVAELRRPGLSTLGTSSSIQSTSTEPAEIISVRTPADVVTESDVVPVFVASARDLEHEFQNMSPPFEGKEDEHNWMGREAGINRLRGMLKGDATQRYPDIFFAALKGGMLEKSFKALLSLRTTLAATTCLFYSELAFRMGTAIDPLVEPLLNNLLKMASFTKKITAAMSQASVTAIIQNTSAQPKIVLNLLWFTLQEKTIQSRLFSICHLRTYLETHAVRSKQQIEHGFLDIVDKSVRKGLADPNIGVKEQARQTFWRYEPVWKAQGMAILEGMDKTGRKQLEKACPDPQAIELPAPEASPPKKSSVAAAIAASRAKAKQIATAPPTLRHQATSHVPAAAAVMRRPGSPAARAGPTPGAVSPVRRVSSPQRVSPPSSVLNPQPIRADSARAYSSASGSSHSPPPSPPSPSQHRRSPSATGSPFAPSSPPRRASQLRSSMSARSLSPPRVLEPQRRNSSALAASVPLPVTPQRMPVRGPEDESLMRLATPSNGSDSDVSYNLINFSTPFERYPPQFQGAISLDDSVIDLTPSTTPLAIPHAVVVEKLRTRAEQAESAADRLLEELVDPGEESDEEPQFRESLLVASQRTTPVKGTSTLNFNGSGPSTPRPPKSATPDPVTPVNNKNVAILRQAALFQDSPVNGRAAPSLVDSLHDKKHETGWWLKRIALLEQGSPLKTGEQANELRQHITALEDRTADVRVMQKLALICSNYPAMSDDLPSPGFSSAFALRKAPPSPPQDAQADIWKGGKLFDGLFSALLKFLEHDKPEELLEYGLIVLWEMLDHQASYIEGHESEVFTLLFRVRYSNKHSIWEATNTIRDALVARIDPIYGLTTMNASLRAFLAKPLEDEALTDARSGSHAFGLLALGKIALRLPPEVLEEELPRLKGILTSGLNNTTLIVRESAAASIIACQLVLRDETHLFTLLDGLADEKKNLLTYLFDKHGARGPVEGAGVAAAGKSPLERLEKEMSRLDTRMNTPPRVGKPI